MPSVIFSILNSLSTLLLPGAILPWPIRIPERSRPTVQQDHSLAFVNEIVTSLLRDLEYHPPEINAERRQSLVQSLQFDLAAFGDGQSWFETICLQSAAMGELSYSGHSFEVQLQIARFTWFMIYFDDLCHKSPASMEEFQRSILTRCSVEEPIMEYFRNHLAEMYRFWDTIPANCIVTATMEYINGCSLEETPTIKNMVISTTAKSWPSYLRTKTGVAAAYAFMIFPKCTNHDLSMFIQVIGDVSTFIDLVNDILSFHKEQLAGEEHNYVHNRAFVTKKSVEATLRDVAREALAAHDRITTTLHSKPGFTPWKHFVNGYLAFHVTQTRYRLSDLGL